MKRNLCLLLCLCLIISACSKTDEARQRLAEANALYESGQYIAAKHLIDSVNMLYPREIEVRKGALRLMRLVERGESEQNIAFCDSVLPLYIAHTETLKKGFVFEKDTAYDVKGVYIWRTMTVERNVERSYIRCGVNEDGEMYVASVYFGARPIEHTGLKLTVKDDFFAATPSIPYDGGLNYRFKDNGNTTEVVTYKGDNCKDIAKLVYNADLKERIKAEYTGGKPFSLYLSEADKAAIKATYALAETLSEITNMNKIREKATKKIELINNKLNKND